MKLNLILSRQSYFQSYFNLSMSEWVYSCSSSSTEVWREYDLKYALRLGLIHSLLFAKF
jgi:hypothetical protein